MKLRRIMLLAGLAVLVSIAVTSEGQAGGGTPITMCGQVVTTSAFLTQNLHCPGSSGVVVGADKVTIDLKGFRLRGDTTQLGIEVNGFDGVTIRNGTVRNFNFGVSALGGADKITVQNLVVSGNFNYGILVNGNSAKVQSSNVSGNSHWGISITGDSATVQSVTASGNGNEGISVTGNSASVKSVITDGNGSHGIFVGGNSAKTTASAASGNAVEGILIEGNAAQVKSNKTYGNGFGGGSDLTGLGIYVNGYTTAPTGKNVAQGNDDTDDCFPTLLC